MIGKIVTAEIGRRLAGRDNGIKGALIGAAAPWLLRRAFTPAGIAIIGAIAAKKMLDNKRGRDRAEEIRLSGVTRSEPATAPQSAPPLQRTAPTRSA
jgi:hypothetical protein